MKIIETTIKKRKSKRVVKSRRPTPTQIMAESVRQQQTLGSVPAAVATESQRVCADSPIPGGWIKVNDLWDPMSCGRPTGIQYNVWIIERYDNKPVGSCMNICSGAPIPSGWVVVNSFWNPNLCGHPTSLVNNVTQIRRI